jgi:Protein of unknown function (DUF1504).
LEPQAVLRRHRLDGDYQQCGAHLSPLIGGWLSPEAKYALVAGSVTGDGMTVIVNAPNPAGFAILKGTSDDGAISPLWLAIAATPPILVAIAAFRFLPG